MALNTVTLQGRIPFEFELKGDNVKVASFALSVQRNYKPEGEQYYPEDLIQCKIFGARAESFAKFFGKGDNVIVQGTLRKDDDYEKDGQLVRGGLYVNVDNFHFQSGNAKKEDAGSTASTPTPRAAAPAPSPKVAAPAAPKASPKITAKPKVNF